MNNLTASEWLEIIFIIVIVSIQIAVAIRVGYKLRDISNFIPDGASLKLKSYFVDGNKLSSLTVDEVIVHDGNENKKDKSYKTEKQERIYCRGAMVDGDDVYFSNNTVPEADALFEITFNKNEKDGNIQRGVFIPYLSTDEKIEMFASHPDFYQRVCTIKVLPSISNSCNVQAKGQIIKEKGSDRWKITSKCILTIYYKGEDDD